MKIYASVLVFGNDKKDVLVLTDGSDMPPMWVLKDEQKEILDIIRDGLYNITGVDKVWYPYINFNTVYENLEGGVKSIYLIYTMYFESHFDISNLAYKWTRLVNLKDEGRLYKIIRYLYTQRK